MTEDDAQSWIAARVSRETVAALRHFVELVCAANAGQNLIAQSTVPKIWSRHVVDSLQLLDHLGDGSCADLGSGPGFPGLPLAIASGRPFVLVESRRKRVEFLQQCVGTLGLTARVKVHFGSVEKFEHAPFSSITARAFAPIDRLLATAAHLADRRTRWVLPKGRSAAQELEAARISWQGAFQIAPSLTDQDAAILIADDVTPRSKA